MQRLNSFNFLPNIEHKTVFILFQSIVTNNSTLYYWYEALSVAQIPIRLCIVSLLQFKPNPTTIHIKIYHHT